MTRTSRIAAAAFRGFVVCFLLAPILVILPLAFAGSMFLSYPVSGWSLKWLLELSNNRLWLHALINSAVVGFCSTSIAVVLGTAAALGLRCKSIPFHDAVRAFFLLPLVIPSVVLGIALDTLYLQWGLSGSLVGVVLAHAVIGVPFVVVNVSIALAGVPISVEQAAASLGAGPFTVARCVTLPLCKSGIASGGIFALATSVDEVVMTLFVAGPDQTTVPLQMFSSVQDNFSPVIAAAALVMIVPAALAVVASLFRYG